MRLDEIKSRLKSCGYLARYWGETRGTAITGSNVQVSCPNKAAHPNGDRNPSATYYRESDGCEHIHCHGCSADYDLLGLIMLDRGGDFMSALRWAAEHFGLECPAQEGVGSGMKIVCQTNNSGNVSADIAAYLKRCVEHYAETDYLRKRGISDTVAQRFGVGYDAAERRVVFPQGSGYAARAVDDTNPMRYRYPKGVGVSPFNLDALWNADKAPVFIVEGQIDALSLIEAGAQAVGLGGTTHTKVLLEAVKARPVAVPVCVAFDNEPNEKTRKAERELSDALSSLGVRRFPANLYPDGCKDANDALLKDRGALASAVAAAVSRAKAEQIVILPDRYTLADIPEPKPESDNPRVVLKNGYLRKGQGLMIVSTSGAGKSVMSIQLAMFWSAGKSLWGMIPPRPLKVGIIQAEDDEEELAFFKRNMMGGLKAGYGWTDGELDAAIAGVTFERVLGRTGDLFIERLKSIQMEQRYDVIIVNPLFSFFGADLSNNKDDAHFFREQIDPFIKNPDYGCAIVFIHHANKPPKSAERKGWGTDAFAQYIGAGGTDVAGWTRAQLVLMPIDGHAGWFKLIAAKRGGKLGWKDAEGNATYERIVAHGKEYVYWRTPTPEEIPADILKTAAKAAKADEISEDDARRKMLDHLRTQPPMSQTDLFNWCAGKFTGFKSKEQKPCRLAYDDLTNHPERYGLEVAKGKHGAKMLCFSSALPGVAAAQPPQGEAARVAGRPIIGDQEADVDGDDDDSPIDPVTGEPIF